MLPAHRKGARWEVLLDTRIPGGKPRHRPLRGGERYDLGERTLVMLKLAR